MKHYKDKECECQRILSEESDISMGYPDTAVLLCA